MNAFLFSDLHAAGSQFIKIRDFFRKHRDISCLIFAGDFVNGGEPTSFAREFVSLLEDLNLPFFWVPGNNDFGPSYEILKSFTPSLEGRVVEFGGRKFTGVGGSPASWAGQYAGERGVGAREIAGTIFISHYPPPRVFNYVIPEHSTDGLSPILNKNSKILPIGQAGEARNPKQGEYCDSQTRNGLEHLSFNHLGFVSKFGFRNSNLPTKKRLAYSPLIHICGHIHTQEGIAHLGSTKIIKLAAAQTGHYAILDLQNLEVDFRRLS